MTNPRRWIRIPTPHCNVQHDRHLPDNHHRQGGIGKAMPPPTHPSAAYLNAGGQGTAMRFPAACLASPSPSTARGHGKPRNLRTRRPAEERHEIALHHVVALEQSGTWHRRYHDAVYPSGPEDAKIVGSFSPILRRPAPCHRSARQRGQGTSTSRTAARAADAEFGVYGSANGGSPLPPPPAAGTRRSHQQGAPAHPRPMRSHGDQDARRKLQKQQGRCWDSSSR